MEPIQRPEMLNGTAARRLRTAIINGEFDLGQPLSESALAASLGIHPSQPG
jgi:DNA-binding GntR family transcriptional regulator